MPGLASPFETAAETGGIINGPEKDGPFIVGRLATFGAEEVGEMTPTERHAQALIGSFGDGVIESPHITVLNGGDIEMANMRHSDGRNMPHTRKIVGNKIRDVNPSRQIECSTAGADLFFTHNGESMLGFYLDEEGSRQTLADRKKLLEALDIKGAPLFRPHISAVRTTDLGYARYVVRTFNKTSGRIRIKLSHLGPGAHAPSHRHLRVV